MSRKKHLLAGVMASALLVFGLAGLDLTKAAPDEPANVDVNNIVEESTEDKTIDDLNIEISKIIKEYNSGKYNSQDSLDFRKSLVAKHNLSEYVDSDYFFKEEYLKDLEEKTLGDLLALIRLSSNTSTKDPNFEASSFSAYSVRSSATVTRPNHGNISAPENSVSYTEGGIYMGRTGVYFVNGNVAFCADHTKTDPPSGTVLTNVHEEQNSTIRKILYYGFGGPQQVSGWDNNALRIGTAMALSNVRNGESKTLGTRLVNAVNGLDEPPARFKAYIGSANSSAYQSIGYWNLEPEIVKGSLYIEKSSANCDISDGNNAYSVQGAVYGLYTDAGATNKIADLTIGADGRSNTVEVDAGTYYVKEITAPKGYALDDTIYNLTVTAGNTAVGKYTDKPLADPIGLLIKKVDAATGNPVATGAGSLEGAEFTVKFYAGEYPDNVDPATTGATPTKTWVLRTNANGIVRFDDSCKVSGDDFYYNGTTNPSLPLGTVTMQETKAPTGYTINPEIFVRKVAPNAGGGIETFNPPTVQETAISGKIKVIKTDGETVTKLAGAEFTIYNKADDSMVTTITTGRDGTAITGDLPFGQYYMKETRAPEGYLKTDQVFDINITENAKVYEFNIENNSVKGKVKVQKIDADITGYKIPGVEFTIYDKTGAVVDKIITNSEGIATSKDLRYGRYTMRETKPAEGYHPNNTVYEIEVDANGKIYEFDIDNTLVKGKIQIVKVDANNEETPVANAEFDVIAENVPGVNKGTLIQHLKTDKNGFAVTNNIRYGTYKLIETKAPDGFWLSTKEYFVDVREEGKAVVRFISNKPIEAKLRVLKTDGDTRVPLKGVTFEIWDTTKNEIVEFTEIKGLTTNKVVQFTTDNDGSILTPQALPYGNYELREVGWLPGYIGVDPIQFTIDEKTPMEDIEGIGTVTTLEVQNQRLKGSVELEKWFVPSEISNTDKPFTTPGDRFKEVLETSKDNQNTVDVEQPKENLPTVEVKQEPDGEPYLLQGVTFALYKAEGGVLLNNMEGTPNWIPMGEYITDSTGKIRIDDLEYGSYKLVEIDMPDNYIKIDDIHFDITEHKQVIQLKAENKIKTGKVEITKFDIHDGTLLPGAEFEILDKDKNVILSGVTDENGLFKFQLETGKYYYKETVAPTLNGTEYVLDEEVYPFEIKEDGEIVKCKAPNRKRISPKTSATIGGFGLAIALGTLGGAGYFIRRRNRI